LHQEQLKTIHHRQEFNLFFWLTAGLSFIASLTALGINLVQNDFGSMIQTMLLNYQNISAQSFWLAMLENLPFGSLTLTFITAAWLCLTTPSHPIILIRQALHYV
jgi:hypothetical protein